MIKYLELYRDYMIVSKGCSLKTLESYIIDIKQYFDIAKDNDITKYLNYIYNKGYSATTQNRKIKGVWTI